MSYAIIIASGEGDSDEIQQVALVHRQGWQAHLAIQFGVPVILLTMGMFVPAMINARQGDLTLFWVAAAFGVIGVALLFFAKLPLYRQGKYLTFGSRALARGRRIAYRIAYIFIGASLLLMLALFAALH